MNNSPLDYAKDKARFAMAEREDKAWIEDELRLKVMHFQLWNVHEKKYENLYAIQDVDGNWKIQ